MEIPVRMRQTQTRQPKQRNPNQDSSVRQRPLVVAVDGEVLPILVDPGTKTGRAELEGHYNYTANRVIFATLQTFCETALVQS